MFSDQKKTNSKKEINQEQNRIAAGTEITGEVKGKGAFRIEGTLEGNLNTTGRVVISESGFLNGILECESADVEGKITGNVKVTEILCLRSTAVFDGEVEAGKLNIETGATFNAKCQMEAGVKKLKKKNEKQSA